MATSSPEAPSGGILYRNAFLLSFFESEFEVLNPKWKEIETTAALWRVVALSEGGKKLLAVRTTGIGRIDSYCIDLEHPGEDSHVEADAGAPLSDALEDVYTQIDLGMTTPNTAELDQLDELIDTLRLFASIED